MEENNLSNKLARTNDAVNAMRERLKLTDDSAIESVAERTDLKVLSNVFIQEEEPSFKEGIWLQGNPNEYPYDLITIDNEIIIPYKWQIDQRSSKLTWTNLRGGVSSLESTRSGSICIHKGSLYAFTDYEYDNSMNQYVALVKFDLEKGGHGERILTVPGHTVNIGWLFSNGEKLFFLNSYNYALYDFDLENKTYTTSGIAYRPDTISYNPYDNSLYCLTRFDGYFYRIDLATKQSHIITTTSRSSYSSITNAGPYAILFKKSETSAACAIFDMDNNGVKLTEIPESLANFYISGSFNSIHIDKYVYLINGLSGYKLNKETLEIESLGDTFKCDDFEYGVSDLLFYQDKFYGIERRDYFNNGSVHYDSAYIIPMETQSKSYENNTVIIVQAPINKTLYQTQLYTYSGLVGRMVHCFYGVYYYNKEYGLKADMPLYYGDGTKWIKFKN